MNQGTKQRIVGTVVLLALALIFLPIIFDGEGSYQDDLASRIPNPPIISILPEPLQTRPVIIADTDAINIAELSTSPSADQAAADQIVSSDEQSTATESENSSVLAPDLDGDEEDGVEVSTSEAVFTREIPQLASNGLPEGWSVRLGSFSDSSNATKLLQDLLVADYKAYSRVIQREQGELTAIFVGPWLDRNRADDYQQQLEEEFNLAGLVVPYEIEKL